MKAARQQAIVDLLTNHKSLTTEAPLCSLTSAKRPSAAISASYRPRGKVLRNHGRAKVIHRENQDSGDPFHIRLKSHYAHKADIAREALAWIEEGMVIALDASSTCWYLARQLPDINIHVLPTASPSAVNWLNVNTFSLSAPAVALSANTVATLIPRLSRS